MFDVIVVGMGAVGAATVYQLAKSGVRTLGIDRFAPPHDMGSSHGETRVTRLATGEGAQYVPLVTRSHEIWDEIGQETGERLLRRCGFAAVDGSGGAAVRHGRQGFFDTTVEAALRSGIRHELLAPSELMRRFPQFRLTGHERVYFEPEAGLVHPERAIAAQLLLARARGAELKTSETVLSVSSARGGVEVRTDRGAYSGGKAVVAAGPWVGELIGRPVSRLRILRQTLHWFRTEPSRYEIGRFPTFIWLDGPHAEDGFYGFPALPDSPGTIKLATEQFQDASPSPGAVDRDVAPREAADMFARHVAGRLAGVTGPAVRSMACMYTHAPDGGFVVDRAPDGDDVLVASACSGHGFKHSAAIGEHVAAVVQGRDALRPHFALGRPAMADAAERARIA